MLSKYRKKKPFPTAKSKFTAGFTPLSGIAFFALLAGCGNINNSWEVKGGGYIKYSVNGGKKVTVELDADDCLLTSYSRHYITCTTQIKNSKDGDQISFMVNNPSTSGKLPPVATAIVNGKNQDVTWFRQALSDKAPLIAESSYIHFDEIIQDSLWTANLELNFKDCQGGSCDDSKAPIHISGRFRYWVSEEER